MSPAGAVLASGMSLARAARLALLAALAATAGLRADTPPPVSKPAVIPLTLPSGKVLQTEVMVRDEDRGMGLMFRASLPQDHGMLFVFEQPGFPGIWMKNCKFPIDILWLDEAHKIVHVEQAVPPCKAEPCAVYQPLRQASFVVELNANQARREKAVIGSEIKFSLP